MIGWLMTGLVALPSTVHAQGAVLATVTGIVQDSSGAVLPGATVEVSSPVLIERVRSAVTDSTGRYRLTNLPAGSYTLTAALTGFNTVRREGLELSGSFTATVNLSLQVGNLEETLTVTGEAPVVDVSSAQRQQVVNNEVMAAIPASRSYEGLAALVPGIQLATNTQNVGGIQGPTPPYFTGHGGSNFEGRLRIDGMTTGGSTGGVSLMALDTSNAAEVTVSTTGGLADAENGGASINIVPRSGGNTLSGTLFVMGAGDGMQSDNFTQELKDAGLRSPSKLDKVWDVNFSMGGPIMRDKLWFFGTIRSMGSFLSISDTFYNRNAGNPNPAFWFYDPDLSRRVLNDQKWLDESLRLTWQATPRNKFTVFWNEQQQKRGQEGGGSPTTSPEASEGTRVPAVRVCRPCGRRRCRTACWSRRRSRAGRPLQPGEAGQQQGRPEHNGADRADHVRIARVAAHRVVDAACARAHGVRDRVAQYEGRLRPLHEPRGPHVGDQQPESAVPGSKPDTEPDHDVRQRPQRGRHGARRGVLRAGRVDEGPVHVPGRAAVRLREQQRAGAAGGAVALVPESDRVPGAEAGDRLPGLQPAGRPGVGCVRHREDVTESERRQASRPCSGTASTSTPTRCARRSGGGSPPTVTRSWTDRNGDYVPQCDFLNSQANGECGTMSNVNFGQVQTPSNTYDPDIMGGWGIRPRHYQLNISAQQEVLPASRWRWAIASAGITAREKEFTTTDETGR